MTRFRHGSLSVDVPEDWVDESTLLFVSPAIELGPSLAKGESSRSAFSIRATAIAEGTSPRQVLAERAPDLAGEATEVVVLEEGPIASGLGEGWSQTRQLTAEKVAVVQILAVFCLGPVAIVAAGTCPEAHLTSSKVQLRRLIESLQTDSG